MTSPYPPRSDNGLYGGTDISGQPLARACVAYQTWFGERYDLGALDCVLAVAAAERLTGDPPWLLVIGGPGHAKTETIIALINAQHAHVVSTINGEAALLSGTSTKDRASDATGGLLPKIGKRGLLVIKDVTSILSMNRDTRALVLAALREIHDGRLSRSVGVDGGRTMTWTGRLVVIGACTSAWDAAHAVITTMGDRFLLVRLAGDAEDRKAASRQAMANVGAEVRMRRELAAVVAEVLDTVKPGRAAELDAATQDRLLVVADL